MEGGGVVVKNLRVDAFSSSSAAHHLYLLPQHAALLRARAKTHTTPGAQYAARLRTAQLRYYRIVVGR